MSRRFLSILLAVLLLLGSLPLSAAAAGEPPPDVEIVPTQTGFLVRALPDNRAQGMRLPQALSGGGPSFTEYDGGDFYSQLNPRQQAFYDLLEGISLEEILAAPAEELFGEEYHLIETQLAGFTGTQITGNFTDEFDPQGDGLIQHQAILADMFAAKAALTYDRPDLLWMDDVVRSYQVDWAGDEEDLVVVTTVSLDFYLEYGDGEGEMISRLLDGAQYIADQAAWEPDRWHKVKSVYDQLAALNTYGDPDEHLSHSCYSALVWDDDTQPVCQGYAEAFKLICNLLEIPCFTPSSENHMWNNVKMDDGEWYQLDVTWGDQDGEEPDYGYFLAGNSSIIEGYPFSQEPSHIEELPLEIYSSVYGSGSPRYTLPVDAFRWPKKSGRAYEYIGRDYDPLRFPDVKRSAWYYETVEQAADSQLFTGDGQGLFLPEKSISRAEFAAVLARALGAELSQPQEAPFPDVSAGAWFAPAAAWVKESGVMQGDGQGNFRPGDGITRQEMCLVLSRAMGYHVSLTDQEPFPDDEAIAPWAAQAVYECRALGLVQGNGRGEFVPLGKTSRSEAAAVFVRFLSVRN